MAYCERCERYFSNENALSQHLNNSSAHNICDDCDKDFATWNSLQQHYVNSPRHHYCQRCDTHFRSRAQLDRHFVRSHHYCADHRMFFDSAEGLRQHYIQSGDYAYCRFCSILFDDFDDLLEHGEVNHYVCRDCVRLFKTERDLLSHNECSHYYCRECDRFFKSESNLEQHRNSSVHKPRTINCIGRGHGCMKTFISVSALVLHAESGTCPAGITRKQVNDFVVRTDRKNLITNPNRLLTDKHGSYYAPPGDEYRATSRSWNGSAYECFFCYAEFQTLKALNAHLASPRHAASIYRCPLSTCETEYSALSALIQHVEWGNCGVRHNRRVKNAMDNLTSKMKRITL